MAISRISTETTFDEPVHPNGGVCRANLLLIGALSGQQSSLKALSRAERDVKEARCHQRVCTEAVSHSPEGEVLFVLMCASTAAIGKQPCAAWAFNTGDCGNTLPRGVVMSFYASD